MEQFVLGIFQEQLAKFIIGFKKEQVNANLLNGKGEITNIELNCAVLNEVLTKVTPYVELERVHCSKLGFHVTSWTNLRKAPIVVDVEHVTATLVEPLHYVDRSQRRRIRQLYVSELFQLIRQGLFTTRGSYNLFDRILDNLSVELQSLTITYQPWGKFKTRRPGPWTPPSWQVSLAAIRVCSVDEFGCEASPDDCWRHNHHHHNHHHGSSGTLFIYKKISMEYQLSLVYYDAATGTTKTLPLVLGLDNVMEIQVALQRRIRDAAILAVQMDCVVPNVEVHIPQHAVPLLAHALAGLQYCLSKDRGFVDPLKSTTDRSATTTSALGEKGAAVQVSFATTTGTVTEVHTTPEADEEELDQVAGEMDDVAEGMSSSSSSSEGEGDGSHEEGSESGDEEVLRMGEEVHPGTSHPVPPTATESLLQTSSSQTTESSVSVASSRGSSSLGVATTTSPTPRPKNDRPVILLPNGLVIYEKISFSFAMHHAVVRGTYAPEDGHVQLVSKGVVLEGIWPKEDRHKGGYLQGSLAFVSIQERVGSRIRTLLVGGAQRDEVGAGPLEQPTGRRKEVHRDETFPLYEDRSVRPDPIGLRYTFPEQAFGLKMTVDHVPKQLLEDSLRLDDDEDISVLHELGIEHFDVLLDSVSWCRAVRFAVNEHGGGFDPRWHSGDWSDSLTSDMLVSSSASTLALDEFIQPCKQLFLDENEFPSSDLFNVTARLKKVEARIPAAILDDVRSSDIIMRLEESMMVVSSALPRTFLSGKVGNSVNGDDVKTKGVIDFPNDASDVAYALEQSEDPAGRQRGVATSRAISTFRLQLTIRGVSIRLTPVIPIGVAQEPQQLVAPTELTVIACFEGEPPARNSNLTKVILFLSVLAHRFDVNIDFELATSAIGTLVYHTNEVLSTIDRCKRILRPSDSLRKGESDTTGKNSHENEGRIIKSLAGRRVRVRRQIVQSRETGGVSVAFCAQATGATLTLWRQNVPLGSSIRPTKASDEREGKNISAMRLLALDLSGVELGAEASFVRNNRRLVLKLCVNEFDLATGCIRYPWMPREIIETRLQRGYNGVEAAGIQVGRDASDIGMVEIVSLGRKKSKPPQCQESLAMRIEEEIETFRAWSFAADLANVCEVSLCIEAVEEGAFLLLESLLVPAWCTLRVNRDFDSIESSSAFPRGSVGDVLLSIAAAISPRSLPDLQTPRVVTVSQDPDPAVDMIIQRVIEKIIPDDVRTAFFRVNAENLLIRVQEDPATSACYGLLVEEAEFLASYVDEESHTQLGLMRVLAKKGSTWATLLPNVKSGLRHCLSTKQKLVHLAGTGGLDQEINVLVESFNFAYKYAEEKASVSMGEAIVLENIKKLERFLSSMHRFFHSCSDLSASISHLLPGLADRGQPSFDGTKIENPVKLTCSSVASTIGFIRDMIKRVGEDVAAHQHAVQEALHAQNLEIMEMRRQLFLKERERLNAMALVSSQVAGWLRVGSSQRIGQRGIMTWNLWPMWSVLRRTLLILHASPTEPSASQVVNLRGASLRGLVGGRRRDLKRAFAIVESTGTVHLVVTCSDGDFLRWVRELQKVATLDDGELSASQHSDSAGRDDGDFSAESRLNRSAVVGRRLTRAVQVAKVTGRVVKATGQAVADRSRRRRESEGGTKLPEAKEMEDVQTDAHSGLVSRGLTRAVQAAKASGQAVVERGRRQRIDSSSSQQEPTLQASVSQPDSDISDQQVLAEEKILSGDPEAEYEGLEKQVNKRQQMRVRLSGVGQVTKSRFGSALQAARQKGMGVTQNAKLRLVPYSTPSSVSNLSPDHESRPLREYESSTRSSGWWTCDECGSINKFPLQTCEKCHVQILESLPTTSSNESNVTLGTNLEDTPDHASGEQLQHEVSSHVPNEKSSLQQDSDAPRTVAGNEGHGIKLTEDALSSISHNQKSGASESNGTMDSGEVTGPTSIRLHSVKLGGLLPMPSHPIHGDVLGRSPMPSRRLDGCWLVRVEPISMIKPVSEDSTSPSDDGEIGLEQANKEHDGARQDNGSPEGREEAVPKTADSNIAVNQSVGRLPSREFVSLDTAFRVQVLRGSNAGDFKHVADVHRSTSEVLDLHTTISELLGTPANIHLYDSKEEPRTEHMSESLASILGLSVLDTVRLTGKLLSGILEVSEGRDTHEFLDLCCDTIRECLSSMLDVALPVEALAALVDFLNVQNVSTKLCLPPAISVRAVSKKPPQSVCVSTDTIVKHLARAESQALFAARLSGRTSAEDVQNRSGVQVVYQTASGQFRQAMYSALMNVMEERDEAHARMVADGVLHAHELDQQRKLVRRLTTEVDALKMHRGAEDQGVSYTEQVRRADRAMQQDSEAELLSLCQQLASEISSRTSASLEIVRLRETREIERQNEAAERVALELELKRTKELLASEQAKLERSRQESMNWKESYQETVLDSPHRDNKSFKYHNS